jgi:endonuclease/exonuclease/phosphatase family metal-dependent hydrolase
MSRLRIGSWNVHGGITFDPTQLLDPELPGIASTILSAKLDVVALQEVRMPTDKAYARAQLETLGKQAGLPYLRVWPIHQSIDRRFQVVEVTNTSNRDGGDSSSIKSVPESRLHKRGNETYEMGVALLSRTPLSNFREERIRPPRHLRRCGCHDKGLLAARLEVAGRSIVVGSVHVVPFRYYAAKAEDESYRKIWKHIARVVRSMADRPMILAGDFNSEKRSLLTDELEWISAPAFYSALNGRPTTTTGRSLDDILFTDPFVVNQETVEVIPTFSDHSLCIAELDLNSASPPVPIRPPGRWTRRTKAAVGSRG